MLPALVLAPLLFTQAAEPSPPPPASTVEKPRMVVLPMTILPGTPADPAASRLFTTALGMHLEELGTWNVIAAEELDALLENLKDRQATGCDGTACLAEVADALGASLVTSTEIGKVGAGYVITASLVNTAEAAVLRRTQLALDSLDALVPHAQDLAFALAGKDAGELLSGAAAARRFGVEETDMAAFAPWRKKHANLSVNEAWTAFLVSRNNESTRLAVAETLLFLGAGLGTVVMGTAGMAGIIVFAFLGWWPAMAGLALIALTAAPISLVLGIAGLVLAAVDALNLGRVNVKPGGCCRQDADLREADNDDGLRKALAMLVTLGGPLVGTVGVMAFFAFTTSATLIGITGLGRPSDRPYTSADYGDFFPSVANNLLSCAFLCTSPLVACPVLCGTPVGLLLLAWPSRDLAPMEDELPRIPKPGTHAHADKDGAP